MVTYQGQTKIVDFGIARIQDELREESGVLPGKASYMSPEQVRGEAVDYRSDIFSLGIMLYEITVGQRLFRGKPDVVMKRIVEDKIPPPTYVRRDFPPALELIVMRALEKRPEDRYQSAEELRHELEDFLENAGLRTGNRRMALYMNETFAPEAEVSASSAEQARGFSEAGTATLAPRNDVSEELNFDRRAPLTMRLEPAPPDSDPPSRYNRPPLPPELISSPLPAPAPAPKANGVHAGAASAVVAPALAAADAPAARAKPGRNRVSTGWILGAVAVFLLGIAAMVFFAAR
jgi:serine/threonine protein kinase